MKTRRVHVQTSQPPKRNVITAECFNPREKASGGEDSSFEYPYFCYRARVSSMRSRTRSTVSLRMRFSSRVVDGETKGIRKEAEVSLSQTPFSRAE